MDIYFLEGVDKMSIDVFENVEVLDIYLENNYQKILICETKDNNDKYLLNIVFDKTPLEQIDFDTLMESIPSMVSVIEKEKNIYIMTKYFEGPSLLAYTSNNNLSLSKQVNNMTYVVDRLSSLKHLPSYILNSLFNHNNLFYTSNNLLESNGLIVFEENLKDISSENVINTLSQTFHVIFAGKELGDNGIIPGSLPPDIEKIIKKCKKEQYFKYNEIIRDYRDSKLFRLMNPDFKEARRVHKMRKDLRLRRLKYKMFRLIPKIAIILLLLTPVIIYGRQRLMDYRLNSKGSNITVGAEENIKQGEEHKEDDTQDKEEDKEKDVNIVDNKNANGLIKYFNEQTIETAGEKHIGVMDYTRSYKGNYSVFVHNRDRQKRSYLIGTIDLEDKEFDYLLGKDISFSLRLLSDRDSSVTLALKLYKDDKVMAQAFKNIETIENVWSLQSLNISTLKGQYIKIYVTASEEIRLWTDDYSVDILK